jgi:Sec7 domain/Pleckstrin homology domain
MEVVDRRTDRDSHDLSLAAARFSVVDSMLMSLSGLPNSPSTGLHDTGLQFPDHDLDDLYQTSPKRGPSSNTGRRRGHTLSSSVDDYDFHVDDLSNRYTAYHSRGRQDGVSGHPRRNTKGENGRITNGIIARAPVDIFDDGVVDKENMHRHARGAGVKGSKSSGSSSVDLGPGYGLRSAFPHGPSRAASFDHSYGDRNVRGSPPKATLEKAKSHAVFDYGNFDAAPTPTVPAGPRRPQEPLSPVIINPPPLTPKKAAPSRKNSIRPSTAKMPKRPKADTMDPSIRDQARQFVQQSNQLRSVHAASQNASAPSPTVGGSRRQMAPPSIPAPPPKERQGFFRRFFGSSKEKEEERRPPSPPLIPQSSSSSHRPKTQPNSQHIATQLKSTSRDAPSSASDGPPHPTLKKMHSSFFRRRKKSMSENAPPPVPPLQLHPAPAQKQGKTHTPVLSARPLSPGLNSLRKAMDPYLHDAKASPLETYFDSREKQSPVVDEAALAVNGERDLETGLVSPVTGRTMGQSAQGPLNHAALLNIEGGDNANLNLNLNLDNASTNGNVTNTQSAMKRGRVGLTHEAERTFFHDSSGTEDIATNGSDPTPPAPHQRNSIPPPTRPAPTSAPQSQLPPNGISSRRANIGEKRLEVLSPISDRSQVVSEPERLHHLDDDDADGFVISNPREGSLKSHSSNRVWLEPSSSEEKLNDLLTLPLEGPRTSDKNSPVDGPLSPNSENDVFASATSSPLVQVDSNPGVSDEWADTDAAKAILVNDTDITPADRERARQIFEGEETFVTKAEAASWLGQTSPKSTRTRRAYMELYNWAGFNILAAFRELCSKLIVKAESQQLDRVIDAFAERWCISNPNHGFKDRDVVHTITYSVLMLNTDLHMADLEQRMTRSQFVKNTLPTIRSIADAAALTAADNADRAPSRQDMLRADVWDQPASPLSPTFPPDGRKSEETRDRPSFEFKRPLNRLSVRPPARKVSDAGLDSAPGDSCNVLVKAPYEGGMKGWEFQVEIVLKEFYNSIRQHRLPLHGVPESGRVVTEQPSTVSLSVVTNALRRTPSVLSKAPSDNTSYRGRSSEYRTMTGRFSSKTRTRPRIYPSSTIGSSRTSLDDQSIFSPAGSTWSKYSFGKTQTSLSVDSFGTNYGHGDYQQAIGFANALSQAIIREDSGKLDAGSEDYAGRTAPLLEDETLELAGPPWAKEGLVKHRHHLESLEKKAKDRGWSECFVVVEKGWMRLFSFNQPSKSLRARMKSRQPSGHSHSGGVVGGGNWTENAEALGAFLLRQTIASALPSPGFSKSRPHVFALSLPTGAVHLFNVGTAEIVKEFVATANYWSARLSKEPLIGGISNIEYGWSDAIISAATCSSRTPSQGGDGTAMGRNGSISLGRGSISGPLQNPGISHTASHSHSSIPRGSLDQRSRFPGDRVQISDWQPPTQSMMASNLMEVDQLRALSGYVQNVEEELKKHNELRPLMGTAVSFVWSDLIQLSLT